MSDSCQKISYYDGTQSHFYSLFVSFCGIFIFFLLTAIGLYYPINNLKKLKKITNEYDDKNSKVRKIFGRYFWLYPNSHQTEYLTHYRNTERTFPASILGGRLGNGFCTHNASAAAKMKTRPSEPSAESISLYLLTELFKLRSPSHKSKHAQAS